MSHYDRLPQEGKLDGNIQMGGKTSKTKICSRDARDHPLMGTLHGKQIVVPGLVENALWKPRQDGDYTT